MIRTLRDLRPWILTATLALLMTCPGCRKDKDDFEIIALEGKVLKVYPETENTGRLSVSYYSEKHAQEIEGTGEVTKDTEILINGVVARLKDIREGERISGEVRMEKTGPDKRLIALKIIINRPKPVGG